MDFGIDVLNPSPSTEKTRAAEQKSGNRELPVRYLPSQPSTLVFSSAAPGRPEKPANGGLSRFADIVAKVFLG
jgi:hypothetical protein